LRGPLRGVANWAETRCNAPLWQGRGGHRLWCSEGYPRSHADSVNRPKARQNRLKTAKSPGRSPGLFLTPARSIRRRACRASRPRS